MARDTLSIWEKNLARAEDFTQFGVLMPRCLREKEYISTDKGEQTRSEEYYSSGYIQTEQSSGDYYGEECSYCLE